MTNKETIERNIGLTFDFINHLIDNPQLAENLPDNFTLEFIEKDFPNIEKTQHKQKSTPVRKFVKVKSTFEFAE